MYHPTPGLHLKTFGHRGAAGGGHVPLNGTEPGIIFGANLNNERVDVTGNHTIANNVLYTAAKSFDGLRHMAQLPDGTSSRIFTDSGTAHNVATASPVSYGGMYIIDTTQSFDNVTLFSSSQGTGATNQNYGLRVKETATAFQRVPGAASFVQTIPRDTHVHLVVVEPAGRLSAKLYVNGILVDTVAPASTGQPNAGNEIWLGELAGAASTDAAGWVSDAFISDLELSDAQVLQFATNAFGGTPPAVP